MAALARICIQGS